MACVECCALLGRRKPRQSVRAERWQPADLGRRAREAEGAESRRAPSGGPKCAPPRQRIEEFELKCYKLTRDRLLVNAHVRWRRLVGEAAPQSGETGAKMRARPLTCLAEGRQFLDDVQSGRPASVSKIRLVYDNSSERVIGRELRVCPIEQDFEPQAEQSASGSFVLLERDQDEEKADEQTSQTRLVAAAELPPVSETNQEAELEDGKDPEAASLEEHSGQLALVAAAADLERELLRSLELKPASGSGTSVQQAKGDRIAWTRPSFFDRLLNFGRRAAAGAPAAMISYNNTEARHLAVQLHAELERLGVRTYLDLIEIQTGSDWQDSLNWAILNCRAFVPLVTRSYGETLWTSRECKLADLLGKRIIPIHFQQTSWPPPSLAIQFATLQYLDWRQSSLASSNSRPTVASGPLSEWPGESVRSIARQIHKCLKSTPADQPARVGSSVRATALQLSPSSANPTGGCPSCAGRAQSHPLALEAPSRCQAANDSGYDTTGELSVGALAGPRPVSPDSPLVDSTNSGRFAYGSLSSADCALTRISASCEADAEEEAEEREDLATSGRNSQVLADEQDSGLLGRLFEHSAERRQVLESGAAKQRARKRKLKEKEKEKEKKDGRRSFGGRAMRALGRVRRSLVPPQLTGGRARLLA